MIDHYWLRALALCLASFALLYIAFSAIVSLAWLTLRRKAHSADFLFSLLAVPLFASIAIVVAIVLPAFLVFESGSGEEPASWALRAFAALGAMFAGAGLLRAANAWVRTSLLVRRWSATANTSSTDAGLPVITTGDESPAVVVTGIARQKLLISRSTSQALSANELRLVISHEREHARRRDNLRKLLLSANVMPFRREIEDRWALSSELDADSAAVSSQAEACDLAAALVKVSRLNGRQIPLATNFAAASPAMLETRVQQLINWQPKPHSSRNYVCLSLSILLAAAVSVPNASAILSFVHRVSEFWMK